MSVRMLTRVWDASQLGGTELLMMLAIADFADDNGFAYPSVTTLAKKCRLQPRRANYILAALQSSGELQVRKNEGPKGTNRYRIVLPLHCSAPLQPSAPLHSNAPTPALECAKPLHCSAPEPSLNRQEPKTTRTRPSASASDVASLMPEVEAQTLKDWAQVRKAKRSGPITATVVKGLRSEAAKAGLTLQQVIETCCVRGWQSFKAGWATEGSGGAARPALDNSEVFT